MLRMCVLVTGQCRASWNSLAHQPEYDPVALELQAVEHVGGENERDEQRQEDLLDQLGGQVGEHAVQPVGTLTVEQPALCGRTVSRWCMYRWEEGGVGGLA